MRKPWLPLHGVSRVKRQPTCGSTVLRRCRSLAGMRFTGSPVQLHRTLVLTQGHAPVCADSPVMLGVQTPPVPLTVVGSECRSRCQSPPDGRFPVRVKNCVIRFPMCVLLSSFLSSSGCGLRLLTETCKCASVALERFLPASISVYSLIWASSSSWQCLVACLRFRLSGVRFRRAIKFKVCLLCKHNELTVPNHDSAVLDLHP